MLPFGTRYTYAKVKPARSGARHMEIPPCLWFRTPALTIGVYQDDLRRYNAGHQGAFHCAGPTCSRMGFVEPITTSLSLEVQRDRAFADCYELIDYVLSVSQ